jgi:hypothetical protein
MTAGADPAAPAAASGGEDAPRAAPVAETSGDSSKKTGIWATWWPFAALLALPLALYGRAIGYGLFMLDDDTYYGNPALHGGAWSGMVALWGGFWFNDYAPVTQATQWLDLALGDGVTWHVARIQSALWLGIGATAVFAALRRMVDVRMAWAIALLYVAHPLCANATLWLAERKNLVAIAFVWWSFERHVAWRTQGGAGGWGRWGAAVGLGAAALLAKSHAIALPAMLFAWEWCLGPGDWRTKANALAPMAGLGAAFLGMEFAYRQDFAPFWFGGGRMGALVCDGDVLARYLLQVVRPAHLTIYYATDEDPTHLARHAGRWAAVLAVVGATVAVARRRRLVWCGWMLAFAGLGPALNLVLQPVPVTDHYVQWALPGVFLALGVAVVDGLEPVAAWLAARGTRLRAPAAWLAGALAVQFAVLTALRVPEFASRPVFFAHAAAVQPDCAQNLAAVVSDNVHQQGRYHPENGQVALRAARLPDARRILSFAMEDTVIEAAVEAWRAEGGDSARQVVYGFPAGVHSADEAYWIMAKVLIGASLLPAENGGGPDRLAEADRLLCGHFGPELMAHADAVGARCRDGGVTPDGFPPVAEVAVSGHDEFWRIRERRDRIRLGLALVEVRRREGQDDSAFALGALCLNLEPQDDEARWTMGQLYAHVLHRPDLAARLDALRAGGR